MITRPSLRDFKQDPELLYETKQLEKEVNKEINTLYTKLGLNPGSPNHLHICTKI